MKNPTLLERRWTTFNTRDNQEIVVRDVCTVLGALYEVVLPCVLEFNASQKAILAAYRELGIDLAAPDLPAIPQQVSIGSLKKGNSCVQESYRREWFEFEDLSHEEIERFPIYRYFVAARAYAFYGFNAAPPDAAGHSLWFELDDFFRFNDLLDFKPEFPRPWLPSGLLLAFNARSKLDFAFPSSWLGVRELAALARVSEKTARNAVAPSGHTDMRTNSKGEIAAADARTWLLSRKDFLPTMEQCIRQKSERKSRSEPERLEDYRFVPVTRTGVWFSPRDTVDGTRFCVGPKTNRRYFDDYATALEYLNALAVPKWHSLNSRGRPELMIGNTWTRKSLTELGLESQTS